MAQRSSSFMLFCVLTASLTGCATARGPLRVEDDVTMWPWSRVAELQSGAQITVATPSTPERVRVFVSADVTGVTVLNLDVPSLTPAAIAVLRDTATHHPEHFAAIKAGASFEQDRVRLGRDGLFVAGRRIADYAQVVETLPRETIREIRGPVVARGSVAGMILGGWLGFCVGVVPGLGGAKAGVGGASLVGGVGLGGWLGNRWSSHTVEDVVYRAP